MQASVRALEILATLFCFVVRDVERQVIVSVLLLILLIEHKASCLLVCLTGRRLQKLVLLLALAAAMTFRGAAGVPCDVSFFAAVETLAGAAGA